MYIYNILYTSDGLMVPDRFFFWTMFSTAQPLGNSTETSPVGGFQTSCRAPEKWRPSWVPTGSCISVPWRSHAAVGLLFTKSCFFHCSNVG